MTWSGFPSSNRSTAGQLGQAGAVRGKLAKLHSLFLDLSTFGKALIGSSVSLAILALVQVINGHVAFGIERSFGQFRDRTMVLETAGSIERRFLDLRQEARYSALTGSVASEAALSASILALNQAVEGARTMLSKPEHRQLIGTISQLLADYDARFRLSSQLRATQTAMTKDFMDDANERIRASLFLIARLSGTSGARETQLRALAGLETALLAQIKVHHALDRPGELVLKDAKDSIAGLRALLVEFKPIAANSLFRPVYEDLGSAVLRFTDSFDMLSSVAQAVRDLNDELMVATAVRISTAIELLRSDALADASQITDKLSMRINDAHLISVALAILALSVGSICAWLISVATAAPVVEMAATMRRLAAGDRSVTPPTLGRRDEVGEMAAAVAVFRESMIEAERLAKIEQQVTEQANRQLEEKVAERTLELEQSKQDLMASLQRLMEVGAEIQSQEKMASLGRIMAGIAHEVNTPLGVAVTASSSITFFGEELRGRIEANDCSQETLKEFLETMTKSAELLSANLGRAARLINSVKQVSADQHIGEGRRMNLAEQIQNIAASLEPEVRKLGHRIELNLDEGLVATLPPDALWQIISNLVINSLAHGLSDRRPGRIIVSLAAQADMAVLRVRDDGVGIPPDIQPNIFEPFFTTKRGRGGTGLGLSLVQSLTTQTLGGRVTCESAPGKGTEISIFFPLQPKPAVTR
jgi:signal transduction histidine kinase